MSPPRAVRLPDDRRVLPAEDVDTLILVGRGTVFCPRVRDASYEDLGGDGAIGKVVSVLRSAWLNSRSAGRGSRCRRR